MVLEDDREFFPKYHPVLYARKDFIERFPRTWERLNEVLVDSLNDQEMSRLNALADLDGMSLSNGHRNRSRMLRCSPMKSISTPNTPALSL